MKRMVPVVAALTLIVAACGGDDDTASEATSLTTDSTEETADPPEGSVADSAPAEPTSDEAAPTESAPGSAPEGSDDATADPDDGTADDSDGGNGGDGGDGVSIGSIDDIPPACQDAMAEFLRALEPIVSPIDWQTATMGEFEQIANDFQEEADEFAAASGEAGCDDLEFDDANEGDILVDFARTEAPGAVGFLEFLEQMRTSSTPGEGDAAETGIETCDDAIDFLQGLMDSYETVAAVPASELMKIPSIAPLYAECTPEQLEFFDNEELQVFMGE